MRDDETPWYHRRDAVAAAMLVATIVGAALYIGGAAAPSVPLFTTVALVALAIAGVVPREAMRDDMVRAALVLIGVTVFQLVPLPPVLLRLLDREGFDLTANALTPFREDLGGRWRPLHLDPGNGVADLQYFVGLLAAYLTAKKVGKSEYGGAVLWGAAVSTALVAGVVLFHKLGQIPRLYGFYATRDAANAMLISPFVNTNHLAVYATSGVVLWVGMTAGAVPAAWRIASLVASLACVATVVLSRSRGGVAAGVAALLLLINFLGWSQRFKKNKQSSRRSRNVLLSALAGSVVLSIAIYGGWEAMRGEYANGDLSKLSFIAGSARVLKHHPVLGIGSGALYSVATAHGVLPEFYYAERAECLPVDLAIAVGPLAAAAICFLALRWLWRCRPRGRSEPQVITVYCVIVGVILHDMVDFSLWIGGVGYFVAALAGVLASMQKLHAHSPERAPSWRLRLVPAVVLSAVCGTITIHSVHYRDRESVLAATSFRTGGAALRQAMIRHPADAVYAMKGAGLALRERDPRALRFVNRALWLAPRWSEPHVLLSRVFLSTGRRSQSLVELRLAFETEGSRFGTQEGLFVQLAPSLDEMRRLVPDKPLFARFLERVATTAGGLLAISADVLLLERDAGHYGALLRTAMRRLGENRGDEARRLAEQARARNPRGAQAYLVIASIESQLAHPELAEQALQRGIAGGADRCPLLTRTADVQAARRDTAAVRTTMATLMDECTADMDQRMAHLAHLGELEVSLGNDGAAMAAYSQADTISAPEHTYLPRVIAIAHRTGSTARLRGACSTLLEHSETDVATRRLCGAP